MNTNILTKQIAAVSIYFDSFDTRLIEENYSDKVSSLVSDLGGQLGLWLGISMVSIFEVLVCCCYAFRVKRVVRFFGSVRATQVGRESKADPII